MQRCKQQIAWSAESQASLADLECRVDESVDRAAAGKVTFPILESHENLCHSVYTGFVQEDRAAIAHIAQGGKEAIDSRKACMSDSHGGTLGTHSSTLVSITVMKASQTWPVAARCPQQTWIMVAHCHSSLL